jgi:hypothetical protein
MDQLLTKQLAIKDNRDPRGVKWGIGKVIGTSLFHIDIVDGNKNSGRPATLQSRFTNPTLAQKAIEAYLTEAWNYSDEQALKLARKSGKDETKE